MNGCLKLLVLTAVISAGVSTGTAAQASEKLELQAADADIALAVVPQAERVVVTVDSDILEIDSLEPLWDAAEEGCKPCVNGMQLYFAGKLRVSGNPMLATDLQKLFDLK